MFGVEGWPACGTPSEALRAHGLDGASLAGRIEALLAELVMASAVWLVLPDQLTIRLFFDAGIVRGLEERLGDRLVAVLPSPRGGRRVGAARPGSRSLPIGSRADSRRLPANERSAGSTGCSIVTLGYYPLAMRLN